MSTLDPATSVCSCDDHLDLYAVPPRLWEDRLPRELVERGPRVVARDGEPTWVCEDRPIGRSGAPANATATALNAIGRAGIEDDGYRAGRPELRLLDMDRDGLWSSVIYGPAALGRLPIRDPGLQEACYAAWNDWAIEEFNAVAPDRLCVLAFLPTHTPEAAAAELQRAVDRGHRGAVIDVYDIDVGDSAWDVLWAAAAEAGVPISFHLKDGTWSNLSYRMGRWQSAAFASVLPLQLDEPLATMVFSGALERHPGLTLVLAESGLGWLPYFLARMDAEWRALRDQLDQAPSVAPSELVRRQVFATFEEEPLAEVVVPMLGADCCMWASDYPHTDSTFPESLQAIEESLGGLPDDDRRKITVTNCARLYGVGPQS